MLVIIFAIMNSDDYDISPIDVYGKKGWEKKLKEQLQENKRLEKHRDSILHPNPQLSTTTKMVVLIIAIFVLIALSAFFLAWLL